MSVYGHLAEVAHFIRFTSSVRATIEGGIARPSALAVFPSNLDADCVNLNLAALAGPPVLGMRNIDKVTAVLRSGTGWGEAAGVIFRQGGRSCLRALRMARPTRARRAVFAANR